MSRVGVYFRSLLASWAGYGANVVVMFFLSPFVVHSLGNAQYGLWSLLMTVTGYLGLVEIGVRVSTGRYINYYIGRGEPHRVSQVVNTSLAFYCLASVLVALAAVVVGQLFTTIFPRVDPGRPGEAQTILLLMAVNVWLGLWSATFQQLLYANNRFGWINLTQVVALGVRAAGTVWALTEGHGLLMLAWVLVASSAVSFVLLVAAARWKGVPARYGRRLASMRCFREIFSFGAWSCIGTVSARVIDYANAAIIGILLGAAEIAYFAIGYMLIDYGRDLLAYVVRVMTPDIQKSAGAREAMGALMVKATNATMLLAVPLLVGFLAFGGEFIRNWMGAGYEKSAEVLMLLAVSQFGNAANMSCGTIINAQGHVKLLAALTAVEATMNLTLSVVLVKYFGMGVVGVAVGIMVPSLVMTGVVLMVVGCRRTGVGIGKFLRATLLRWAAATAVMLPLCLLLARAIGPGAWGSFWLKVALAAAVYAPLGPWIILGPHQTWQWLERLGIAGPRSRRRAMQETHA